MRAVAFLRGVEPTVLARGTSIAERWPGYRGGAALANHWVAGTLTEQDGDVAVVWRIRAFSYSVWTAGLVGWLVIAFFASSFFMVRDFDWRAVLFGMLSPVWVLAMGRFARMRYVPWRRFILRDISRRAGLPADAGR